MAQVLGFADYLFKNAEYYRAITEYQRALYFSQSSFHKDSLQLKIGECYFKGKQHERASQIFCDIYAKSSNEKIRAISHYFLGCSYLHQFDIPRSYACFAEHASKFPQSQTALRSALIAQKIRELGKIKKKSSLIAGVSSFLLPGSGQVYGGKPTQGIFSLVTVSLFTYYSIGNLRKARDITRNHRVEFSHEVADLYRFRANVYAAIAIIFHFGNVYNAVALAEQANFKSHEQLLQRVIAEADTVAFSTR